jgi:hypothetical protein
VRGIRAGKLDWEDTQGKKTCGRRKRYGSRALANLKATKSQHVYRCSYCDGYHFERRRK